MDQQVLSKREKPKFHNEGFLYTLDGKSKSDETILFWRCQRRDLCKARVHTRDGVVIKEVNAHTHDSSASSVEISRAITSLKMRSADTVENTSQVINECMTDLSQASQASLPNMSALRKIVRRKRNEIKAAPPNPTDLQQLEIPQSYRIYSVQADIEENFLVADVGEGAQRILLFGRESWLPHLKTTTWYADGTFSIAPQLFSQVYTIMGSKFGGVHPVLYALLPNKQRATYSRLFEKIKELVPDVAPRAINCDFEQAAFTAMLLSFPNVTIRGCFFHLSQNLKKHVIENGLSGRYNNEAEFSLRARMIICTAFVPMADLDASIEALENYLEPELIPILNWFEDNYLGRPNRRGNGRRVPLFPPEMWNLYERVLNGDDRTNNHAEAAHRRLQCELGMDHPIIWKFIDGLRKVQKGRDLYMEQLTAGQEPPKKLKKYRDADTRILNIVRTYDDRRADLIDYLRGLAHNYQA